MICQRVERRPTTEPVYSRLTTTWTEGQLAANRLTSSLELDRLKEEASPQGVPQLPSCFTKVLDVEWVTVEKPLAAGLQWPLEPRVMAAQPGILSHTAMHSASLPIHTAAPSFCNKGSRGRGISKEPAAINPIVERIFSWGIFW